MATKPLDAPAKVRVPGTVSRLIVHQFDLAQPVPGGIDTCIRGLCRFADPSTSFAIIGVDAIGDSRRLGRWEVYDVNGRRLWFMPVATLDPADQRRRIPHTIRLLGGVIRYRHRVPRSELVQAHRADTGLALRFLFRRRIAYFIHTQESGISSQDSDSIWRKAGRLHRSIEQNVASSASSVVVFNPSYLNMVKTWNEKAISSPTWFDPKVFYDVDSGSDSCTGDRELRIAWVGRLEHPKDPLLAIEAFEHLSKIANGKGRSIRLDLVGDGTEIDRVKGRVLELPTPVRSNVYLRGRLSQETVADLLRSASVFLMTSHPGYEGYPRVLVESMACGTPAVVTTGADTGGLVENAVTGYTVATRGPAAIAEALVMASTLDRQRVRSSIDHLQAEQVVKTIVEASHNPDTISPVAALSANSSSELEIDGRPVFPGGMGDLMHRFDELVTKGDGPHLVVTPNVDQMVKLAKDGAARAVFEASNILVADGKPLVWLARVLGAKNLQRIAGADVLDECSRESAARGWSVLILGGPDGAAAEAAARLNARNPGSQITGISVPQLALGERMPPEILDQLWEARPNIVFICLGFPKQETWYIVNKSNLPRAVYVGAGAAVEFASGFKKRAPAWIQAIGFEWFFRLAQEPGRLASRYLIDDIYFLQIAIASIRKARK